MQLDRGQSRILTWTGSKQGGARLWNLRASAPSRSYEHETPIYNADFNHDASRILAWQGGKAFPKGAVKDTALLLESTQSSPIQAFEHGDIIIGARFSWTESRVATWSRDGEVKLWQLLKADPLQTFRHDYLAGVELNADESHVLTWGDNAVRLWRVEENVPERKFEFPDGVRGAQFCRGGTHILAWGSDVKLWKMGQAGQIQVVRETRRLDGARLNRDESRLLMWSNDPDRMESEIQVWNVIKPEPLQTFNHSYPISGASFDEDNMHVLTWSQNGREVLLWDLETASLLKKVMHDSPVTGALLSRNGLRLLTWDDRMARMWNITDGEPFWMVKLDGGAVGAQFNSNGSRVLTWSFSQTVKMWDTVQDEPLMTFKHDRPVTGARFSYDESRVLVWGGGDYRNGGAVSLWHIKDPMTQFTPSERILELEVRSATTLDRVRLTCSGSQRVADSFGTRWDRSDRGVFRRYSTGRPPSVRPRS